MSPVPIIFFLKITLFTTDKLVLVILFKSLLIVYRGGSSKGAAGAFAPAEIW